MNNLAEIVTLLPMRGITIPYFIKRFVDPSLAFAAGWNYWYAYAILVAAEATAGAILLEYWETPVHNAVWITIFLVVVLFLNIVAVEVFGEAEFWFASIKFITIIGLVILGFVIMLGGSPNDQGRLGFRYWNNPGAFKPYIVEGNSGRFLAYWTAFVRAGFAFITSPELIALAAGETIAPRRNIPKAAGRFVYRLAIFYGLGSFIIGVIVPSDDDRLLSGSSNASASPFVIGIQRAGIQGLNHVVNAAVLTSAWSAGNAFLFSGSRVLYGMALKHLHNLRFHRLDCCYDHLYPLPQGLDIQQLARVASLPYAIPAIPHILYPWCCLAPNPHERIPSLCASQLVCIRFLGRLYHYPHFLRSLRRPQDLLQNRLRDQG